MRGEQRAGDPVPNGTGLPRCATAGHEDARRVATLGLRHAERRLEHGECRPLAEVVAGLLAVDDDPAVAGQKADARHGRLAPARPVDVVRAHRDLLVLQLVRGRLLRLVRMLRAAVDLQLLQHGATDAVPRQHPLHRALDDELRLAREERLEALLLQAAGIVRMAVVALLRQLVAGDPDAARVHDHDVVADVDVRGVGRLVLALEQRGDPRRQPAERLVAGVDQPPASLDLARLDCVCLHGSPSSALLSSCPAPAAPARWFVFDS